MHWSPGMWQTFLIYGARLGKQGRRISGSGQGDHGGTWKSTKNGGTGSKRPGTREHRTLAQTHSERSGNGDPPQPQKDSGSGSGAPRRKAKPAGLKAQAVFEVFERFASGRSRKSTCYSVKTTPTELCPFFSSASIRTT